MILNTAPRPGFVDGHTIYAIPEQDKAEQLQTQPLLDFDREDGGRYWVLVLSETSSRLYQGIRDTLTPVLGNVFPAPLTGRHIAQAAGEQAEGQDEVTRDSAHFEFVQAVDRRVSDFVAADPWPLVLVGTSRGLASFCCLTRQRHRIIGFVRGEHVDTPATELARLVWPLVLSALVRGPLKTCTGTRTPRPKRWLVVQSAQRR